jgi:gamma-glutamylputrescine oxidase
MKASWLRHFDDNRSLWLSDKAPYESAPPLDRDLGVDVAIIGGGFTGVSTAYHLSNRFPNLGIAVLEAKVLANGASGRNGGQMLNWVHGFEAGTPAEAARIYARTREGIDGVLRIIADHALEVPFRRDGHLEIFTERKTAERAQAELESLSGPGLPLRFLGTRELRTYLELEGATGAVLDPFAGQIDGLAFVRALRPVLEARGILVFEGTPATRVHEGRRVEIETPSGLVTASTVVLAANAYTPHLGYFGSGVFALHSHVIGTESLAAEDWARLGWKQGVNFTDDRGRLSYGTLTSSGRVLFGGGSNTSYHYGFGNRTSFDGAVGRGFEDMRRQLIRYLPGLEEVPITRRWSGPVALTLSRLCTMGARGEHRNVLFALGYSGHGVTLANLAGQVLTDVYSGADERWRGLPFYQQRLRYIPPEPFRYLGYHAFIKATGRSPRVFE